MVEATIVEILGRHGTALTDACRTELSEAMMRLVLAPSVSLHLDPEASFEATTSQHTWTGFAEAPTQSNSVLPSRYEDLGLLGYGGMGQVRRVRDRVLGREVALKMIRTDSSARSRSQFSDEAKVTAKLQHPGIVPIYDFGVLADGVPFYTMPVVSGRSLAHAIARVHKASSERSWQRSWDG
ncbi:MAG: hypothetical protein KC912_25340, partial [Proteobacteria bacterium]|nr:hypothetical protein [Pseudomonadota bacterium]